MDRSVIDWDYTSNKDSPPELRILYMLFYQMSRMCREKGAVKHDDRIDCLAQGVKYFTDAFGISARDVVRQRKLEEWNHLLQDTIEYPHESANHLVLGMNAEQRAASRGNAKNVVPNWV